jgi:DNA gyrase subunit A
LRTTVTFHSGESLFAADDATAVDARHLASGIEQAFRVARPQNSISPRTVDHRIAHPIPGASPMSPPNEPPSARQDGLFQNFAREVVEIPVSEEMSESFLQYSLSVITSRAIPDVRDGLKPVQRRVLYAMRDMGLRPDRPRVKSAKVVGTTMGSYHPHGDMSIYETLARMAQDFSRQVTFVDPQGNFGSLDDPPAAQRYTECRLSEAAMTMVDELDEDTVDFRPTYDGESEEPITLPAKLPNLLVNGTSGIAVGMATNMPTHNLREVFEAIKLVLTKRRPRPTIDELLAVMPGPDFPSGGIVVTDSLREAYETGRGSVRMRAKTEVIELNKGRRQGIVVTELPFMVGPERVVARIKELVNDAKLAGVDDVVNLSDRKSGLRIQITCKPGVNPHAVLADLYRQTPMEETFGINNVVLVRSVPTTLGLYDLCQYYIEHRLEVIQRRTEHRLHKAEDRLHIVEGLLIALDVIDEVIRIIRSADDVPNARSDLMTQLGLSEVQANYVLDLQLRRLTRLARLDLETEAAGLQRTIDDLRDLLASENRQRRLVLTELGDLVDKYGRPRRSQIMSPDDLPVYEAPSASATPAVQTNDPCIVTLSVSGVVGRTPADGAKRATPGRHDVLAATALTTTHTDVWLPRPRGAGSAAVRLHQERDRAHHRRPRHRIHRVGDRVGSGQAAEPDRIVRHQDRASRHRPQVRRQGGGRVHLSRRGRHRVRGQRRPGAAHPGRRHLRAGPQRRRGGRHGAQG